MLIFLVSFLITICLLIVIFLLTLRSFIRKKPFPKKMMIALCISVVICSFSWIYIQYFFTFDNIDRTYMQEGPQNITSSDERYVANVFYEPYGGAAGGVNTWVEVTDQHSNETKVIYYADAQSTVTLNWVDDETLHIRNEDPQYLNRSQTTTLHVATEIYDEFGHACKSFLLKDTYEKCFSD